MGEPLVSVIIPVYNASEWLDRCLSSIVRQLHRNIEILLLVGNCEDNSLRKCLHWQEIDERIIVVSRQDYGQGDARNYGMKLAQGKYIAFVDADDWVSADYISSMINSMELDDTIDASCCGLDGIEDNVERLPSFKGKIKVSFELICTRTWSTIWIYLYRREWLENKKMQMFDGCHEDDAWRLMLAAELRYVYFVQKALYHYNSYNAGSSMHKRGQRRNIIAAMTFAMNRLVDRGTFDKYKVLLRNYFLNTWNFNYRLSEYDCSFLEEERTFLERFFPEILLERKNVSIYGVKLTDNLIFCGAGEDAHTLLFRHYLPVPKYLIDNDVRKNGKYCEGSIIRSYDYILKENKDVTVVISSSKYYYELAAQLRIDGINNILPVEEYPMAYMFRGKNKEKRIIHTYVCESNDVGSMLTAEAERAFLSHNFPEYDVIEITDDVLRRNGRWLHKYVKETDIVVFSGGELLGSQNLNSGENALRILLKNLKKNRFVIMPQTIIFSEDTFGKSVFSDTLEVWRAKKGLAVCLKDNESWKLDNLLKDTDVIRRKIPDIRLSINKGRLKKKKTKQIAISLRTDAQSRFDDENREALVKAVCDLGQTVTYFNIKVDTPFKRMIRTHEQSMVVRTTMERISSYDAVVTDDASVVLMCVLTGTPCICFDSLNSSVSGLCYWLEELPYVTMVVEIDAVENELLKVMSVPVHNREFKFDYEPYRVEIIRLIKGSELNGQL